MRRLSVIFMFSLAAAGFGHSAAKAAEILQNGGLEESVSPAFWNLTTSVTGEPGLTVPGAIEHVDGANEPTVVPGQLGLLIKPPAGNQGVYEGQNKMFNVTLEQIVTTATTAIVPGRTYTMTGHAFLQDGYSGIVDTLNEESPSGAIASPTNSYFDMTFLDSSDVELAAPLVFDMRDDPTTLAWRTHMLAAVAPATTSKIRVRAFATDIVDNCCSAGQDLMFDNFTLRDNVSSGVERLQNASLNTPGEPAGFTVVEGPDVPGQGTPDSVSFINFANHTSGGQQGMWLRPFVNTTQFEPDIATVDAVMSQVVDAAEGNEYSFSAWSFWESGYSGAIPSSGTETFLRLEFLDSVGDPIGSPSELELFAAGQMADSTWRQFTVPTATAPAGTVEVRASLGATGMFNSFFNPQSAFFDDLSLIETIIGGGLVGDYNGDDVIDGADYTTWRDAVTAGSSSLLNDPTPGTVDESDFTYWRNHYGETLGSGAGSGAAAVPEPGSLVLLTLGMGLAMAGIRRSRS